MSTKFQNTRGGSCQVSSAMLLYNCAQSPLLFSWEETQNYVDLPDSIIKYLQIRANKSNSSILSFFSTPPKDYQVEWADGETEQVDRIDSR